MACANRRRAHRRRSAGFLPSHQPGPPWRTPQLAGRWLVTAQLLGCRGEPFVQGPGALLRERLVQLIALRLQRLVQLFTLLFECPFWCPGVVARRPKYCAASVPISVRKLTLAAMIAAVTSGLMSGT